LADCGREYHRSAGRHRILGRTWAWAGTSLFATIDGVVLYDRLDRKKAGERFASIKRRTPQKTFAFFIGEKQ
jgi:hypothetical protein